MDEHDEDESGIIRVEKDRSHPYKTINTSFANDERLSWAARGLLVYLLSKPDNWKVKTADLVKRSPAGRRAVLSILSELEDCGYLVRRRRAGKGGRFIWSTTIYEVAQSIGKPDEPECANSTMDEPECGFASMDEAPMVDASMVNSTIYKVRRGTSKEVITKESSGGVAPPSTDAAAADQNVVTRLVNEVRLTRKVAIQYATLHAFTDSEIDRLIEWCKVKRSEGKNPAAILTSQYAPHGDLPDDLPAARRIDSWPHRPDGTIDTDRLNELARRNPGIMTNRWVYQ